MWTALKPWKLIFYEPNLLVDKVGRKSTGKICHLFNNRKENRCTFSNTSSPMLVLSVGVGTQMLTAHPSKNTAPTYEGRH